MPSPPAPEVPPAHRIAALPPVGACLHAAVGPADTVAVAGRDGVLRVLSAASDQLLARCALPGRERPREVAWSPWRRHVGSRHDGGAVVVWNVETEVPLRVLRSVGRADSMAFSADGRWLAVGAGHCVKVFDSAGREVRTIALEPLPEVGLPTPGGRVSRAVFAQDDRCLLVTADDGTLRQYDVRGRLSAFRRHPSPVTALAVTTDRIATGCVDGRLSEWTWEGRLRHRSQHPGRIAHLAFSPGGALLAAVSDDRALRVWSRDGALTLSTALPGAPAGLGFLRSGEALLTATTDGALDVWTTHAAPAAASSPRFPQTPERSP